MQFLSSLYIIIKLIYNTNNSTSLWHRTTRLAPQLKFGAAAPAKTLQGPQLLQRESNVHA